MFDWAPGWEPVVAAVAAATGRAINFAQCDVRAGLEDEANAALADSCKKLDAVVLSFVLLEADTFAAFFSSLLVLLGREAIAIVLDAGSKTAGDGCFREVRRLAGRAGFAVTTVDLGKDGAALVLAADSDTRSVAGYTLGRAKTEPWLQQSRGPCRRSTR